MFQFLLFWKIASCEWSAPLTIYWMIDWYIHRPWLHDLHVSSQANVHQRCSGVGTRGDVVSPLFSTGGTRPPFSQLFGLKFMQNVVHRCNWLLTELQCKIIVSTAELISNCYRHSPTSSCIAWQDQRSAVAVFVMCMNVRVCRPKLFKNLCLSVVSGVPHLLFRCCMCVWHVLLKYYLLTYLLTYYTSDAHDACTVSCAVANRLLRYTVRLAPAGHGVCSAGTTVSSY